MKNKIMKGSLGDKSYRLAGIDEQSDVEDLEPDIERNEHDLVASGILANRSGRKELSPENATRTARTSAPTANARSAQDEAELVAIESLASGRIGKSADDDGFDRLLGILENATNRDLSGDEKNLLANIKALIDQIRGVDDLDANEAAIVDDAEDLVESYESKPKTIDKAEIHDKLVGPFSDLIDTVIGQDHSIKQLCERFNVPFAKARDFELSDDEDRLVKRAERLGRIIGSTQLGRGVRVALKHAHRNLDTTDAILKAFGETTDWSAARSGSVHDRMEAKERERTRNTLKEMIANPVRTRAPRDGAHAGVREAMRQLLRE